MCVFLSKVRLKGLNFLLNTKILDLVLLEKNLKDSKYYANRITYCFGLRHIGILPS